MSNGEVLEGRFGGLASASVVTFQDLAAEIPRRVFAPQLVTGGRSVMGRALARAEAAAATTSSVFVYGETGTGKDLIARAIHAASARAGKPFVRIDCASLCDGLVESELFGHRKGSFTSAHRDRKGMFLEAHRGTLFLDEIDKTPKALQCKFLGAVEHRHIRAVGDDFEFPADVRIISASSKLVSEILERELMIKELFYRLDVIPIYLPPLRERRDDIPLLVGALVDKLRGKLGCPAVGLTRDALDLVVSRSWPGNVRQLERFLERALVLLGRKEVLSAEVARDALMDDSAGEASAHDPRAAEVSVAATTKGPAGSSCPTLVEAERTAIQRAMEAAGGHREGAAALLGTSRRNLQRLLAKHGLS